MRIEMIGKEFNTSLVRIVYWRDIPSRVEAEDASCVVSRTLSDRFQNLIGKLAKRRHAADEMSLDGWREGSELVRSGDAIDVAAQVIDELEKEFEQFEARRDTKSP
jgi:hypothetical protein